MTMKKEKGIFLDGLRKIFLAKSNKDQIRANKIWLAPERPAS